MKIFFSYFLTIVLMLTPTSGFAQTQPSPEQTYLRNAAEEQFGSMRESAQKSFRGILLYPEDIQVALLELSQHPELVVLMNETKVVNEEKFKKKLEEYPEETQEASQKLKEYLEIVRIMNKHLVVTTTLGEIYKKDKEVTTQVMMRLGKATHAENEEAAQAWTNRLDEDPKTLEELKKAAGAHAKENNLPNPNQPVSQQQMGDVTNIYNNYGYYVDPKGQTVVYGMPSQDFMSYMMLQQTTYMLLFSSMAWHHHHYSGGHYWYAYDDYWEDRYDDYENSWNDYNDSLNGVESGLNELNQNIGEIQDGIADRQDQWQDKKDDWKDQRDRFCCAFDRVDLFRKFFKSIVRAQLFERNHRPW